jgi:spoIIIJ-associated protein
MSSGPVYEAKTVEKAVKKASDELSIPSEQLKYDIISYGSNGIFSWLGFKKAQIQVVLPVNAFSANRKSAPVAKPNRESTDEIQPTEPAQARTDAPCGEQSLEIPPISDAAVEVGLTLLQKIVTAISEQATVNVTINTHQVFYHVTGGDASVLIGKRGQTLEAIQYIVEKAVNKQDQRRVRVQIDIEGYLKNRETHLNHMASRLAEKVPRTGKPISVGHMNAHDRRIIHLTLKSNRKVRTQSIGDGLFRKLVIFPKKNPHRIKGLDNR